MCHRAESMLDPVSMTWLGRVTWDKDVTYPDMEIIGKLSSVSWSSSTFMLSSESRPKCILKSGHQHIWQVSLLWAQAEGSYEHKALFLLMDRSNFRVKHDTDFYFNWAAQMSSVREAVCLLTISSPAAPILTGCHWEPMWNWTSK